MALKVFWTIRAELFFNNIIKYLQTEWNESVTKAFIIRVYETIDLISEFPEIGSIENHKKGIRGFVILKQITLFYRIKNETVIILSLFDNRKNPKKKHL